MNFAHPERLFLLVIVPLLLLVYYYGLRSRRRAAIKFAHFEALKKITSHGSPFQSYHILLALFMLALSLLVVAVAKPQAEVEVRTTQNDVVLAIDVSGSMRAIDYTPNRLEAAKASAKAFARELEAGDRIGVVVFSGVSRIVSPLSGDREMVRESIEAISFGAEDGTAIGDGLVSSASLLSGSRGRNSFVVLLSDGQNNRGVAPRDAARYAKALGVKVYTVGIGSARGKISGTSEVTGLDEETLRALASASGGDYRLAKSEEDLEAIYSEMAKVIGFEVEYRDISEYFLTAALLLLTLEFVLASTRFRAIP